MDNPIVLTIHEAIDASRIAKTKIYAEIKAGRLPIIKIGRRTLIRREALEAWLRAAERRVEQESA